MDMDIYTTSTGQTEDYDDYEDYEEAVGPKTRLTSVTPEQLRTRAGELQKELDDCKRRFTALEQRIKKLGCVIGCVVGILFLVLIGALIFSLTKISEYDTKISEHDAKFLEYDMKNSAHDCSCSEFINKNGYGQCKKGSVRFNGSLTCYVKWPSTCTDLVESTTNPGKWFSYEPCKHILEMEILGDKEDSGSGMNPNLKDEEDRGSGKNTYLEDEEDRNSGISPYLEHEEDRGSGKNPNLD